MSSYLLRYLIFFILLILCNTLLFSQYMFHNLLFLPIIGVVFYRYYKRYLISSILFSMLLVLLSTLQHTLYNPSPIHFFFKFIDSLYGMFLWGVVSWILIVIGIVITYNFTKYLLMRSTFSCLKQVMLICINSIMIGIILFFYNYFNGNPFTKLYAFHQMTSHLNKSYPDTSYTLPQCTYDFKSGKYSSDATMNTSKGPYPFYISYKKGKVVENYYSTYIEDIPNSIRLSIEASHQIQNLLDLAGVPTNSVRISLSVPLDKYDTIPFSPSDISEPLEVFIYKLTDVKESPQSFANWCESIRKVLQVSDFNIKAITLTSDPHFYLDKLKLTLTKNSLAEPITNIINHPEFLDHGKINHCNTLSKEAYESQKQDILQKDPSYILKAHMTPEIINLLHPLGLSPIIPSVRMSPSGVDLEFIWTGDIVSPNTFASQCIAIKDIISQNPKVLLEQPLQSISFKYYWGSSMDCYTYSLDEDTGFLPTPDDIILDLFQSKAH